MPITARQMSPVYPYEFQIPYLTAFFRITIEPPGPIFVPSRYAGSLEVFTAPAVAYSPIASPGSCSPVAQPY